MAKSPIGIFIIASAIIWAAVILGASGKLSGTGCYDEIKYILYGGFIAHLFFVWAPLTARFKKNKETEKEEK